MSKNKKIGDRRDAKLIKDIPPLNKIMACMYPNRCDNEAFINVDICTDKIDQLLSELNKDLKEDKYTIFHILIAALHRLIIMKPKLNYFIQNKKFYYRNDISFSFVIKKKFKESSSEGLAFLKFSKEDNLITIHNKLTSEINKNREIEEDSASKDMRIISQLPHFLVSWLVSFLNFLDRIGKYPKSLAEVDMNYASIFLSNVGSIGLNAGYHHLTNRGTNSIFVLMGKTYQKQVIENGEAVIKTFLPLGLTIDERIVDGFYYSRCIKLMEEFLNDPKILLESLK